MYRFDKQVRKKSVTFMMEPQKKGDYHFDQSTSLGKGGLLHPNIYTRKQFLFEPIKNTQRVAKWGIILYEISHKFW